MKFLLKFSAAAAGICSLFLFIVTLADFLRINCRKYIFINRI